MNVEKWAKENEVPKDAILYVRVHENLINKRGPELGLPNDGAFYNTPKKIQGGTDLSSDWNRFCSPQETKDRTGREYKHGEKVFKDPSKYYVVSFLVQDILELNLEQEIEHSPRQENYPEEKEGFPWNRAHCSISGDDEERRLKMKEIAKWEIAPDQYNSEADKRTFRH